MNLSEELTDKLRITQTTRLGNTNLKNYFFKLGDIKLNYVKVKFLFLSLTIYGNNSFFCFKK